MSIKVYSVGDKKKVAIVTGIKIKKYSLPNGNVVSILCGKSKDKRVACTIITNEKPKPCKSGPRTKKGAVCRKN
jgi:hypothetical protein